MTRDELAQAPGPARCLCSHLHGSHQADPFTGKRSGPCVLRACGCGSYRPDPGRQQRQEAARRTA